MAEYALVRGELAPVTKLGQRAICWDPECSWEMIARPGNGKVLPHWAHKPGSTHTYSTDSEKGEWHREVQHLFRIRGAELEVPMISADGQRDHRADVVCADGRIVEAQTRFLSADDLASREATYGDMCWLYDARDFAQWFIIDNPNDPARFNWGKPDRAFMLTTKPVYLDTGEGGVWALEQMHARHKKGNKGRVIYEGRRRKVADNLLAFVDKISSGAPFHARARLTLIDPRKSNRGVRFHTLTDINEWADRNQHCAYETFVLDEAVEQAEQAAEAARLAEMVARYEAEQKRLRALQQQQDELSAFRLARLEADQARRTTEQQAILQRNEANQAAQTAAQLEAQSAADMRRRPEDQSFTDWERFAGLTCTCRPGCTDVRWGDAGICDHNCRPCRIMAGVTYTSPRASRKTAE